MLKQDCKCSSFVQVSSDDNTDISEICCQKCFHEHYSPEQSKQQDDWVKNHAFQMATDCNTLYNLALAENDIQNKQLYFSVLKVIKALANRTYPQKEDVPPYERPSLITAFRNLLVHKFSGSHELSHMLRVAKFILSYINMYKLTPPIDQCDDNSQLSYRLSYMRWFIHCHVPLLCPSLPYYQTSTSFGCTFYKMLLPELKLKISDSITAKWNKTQNDEINAFERSTRRFLHLLEEELSNPSTPVWTPYFQTMLIPEHDIKPKTELPEPAQQITSPSESSIKKRRSAKMEEIDELPPKKTNFLTDVTLDEVEDIIKEMNITAKTKKTLNSQLVSSLLQISNFLFFRCQYISQIINICY
ncbi:Histone acetyltransferase kat2b [Cichlidogyrus casuarinus]|uniref:Histone acetyltransferase kat2b n=1 Tax=Cichlidogyrus casuarinus TaxID=1844966 RepID=A0ABD2QP19_9PLAT